MKNPLVIVGLALSLLLAGGVSYYASSQPDGFEKAAGEIGFLDTAEESPLKDSPLAEYGVAGVENERLSGALAGLIGVAATAAISFAIFFFMRRFNRGKV
uniref:PDGLE domain-containing protein n=1 Tax=Candidatus Planktophila sp. TaxID=2175601 RepID=UPI00404ABBBE